MVSKTQQQRDHQRQTYRLYFPADLDNEDVVKFIRSISGTLRAKKSIVSPVPSVVFELWGTPTGIKHRLKVPFQHSDYVLKTLHALIPGIRYEEETEWPKHEWTRAVEIGLSDTSRQLRIYSPEATATAILSAMQDVGEEESILIQWVVTPAPPRRAPISQGRDHADATKDRRQKLEEPNLHAVVRVASKANTEPRADHLIFRVRAALASTRSAETRFEKRLATKQMLQKRIDLASTPKMYPAQLSAPELATLIAFPIGNPFISGLPQPLSRRLPVSDLVPREGRTLGRSNMPGNERVVAMSYSDACKHVHVLGPTGVGKTVLLANMIKSDMEAGHGVIVIESKGDLFRKALGYVPPERHDDVIVLDVNDRESPVGFNIMQQGDSRTVVDEIMALFEHLYSDARGVWVREILYHSLNTLATDPAMTFVDLVPLLSPMTTDEIRWADDLKRSLKDSELRHFWQRYDNKNQKDADRFAQPVLDRVWQLNARPELRRIIGQSTSSFDMHEVIENNKILLVNLSGLPKDTVSLTGTLLVNAVWHAVQRAKPVKPNFLVLDEFQQMVNLPIEPETMLAQARSLGLGMVLAHQHLAQLPREMKAAVLANARTKVIFQSTADDANVMVKEFGSKVTADDFLYLGKYEALVRVATGDGVSAPLTLTTMEPAKVTGQANELVEKSRSRYGRSAKDVDKEIMTRRHARIESDSNKRPPIGQLPDFLP